MKYWMFRLLINIAPDLSNELREHACNLLSQLNNPKVDDDTKWQAIYTLKDILKPSKEG